MSLAGITWSYYRSGYDLHLISNEKVIILIKLGTGANVKKQNSFVFL